MKLSEKLKDGYIVTQLNVIQVRDLESNIELLERQREELENQVRELIAMKMPETLIEKQKTKRFFRTSDNIIINSEHIIMVHLFKDTSDDLFLKVIVLYNQYLNEISVKKEDLKRFKNWLKSWSVDSPEEDN